MTAPDLDAPLAPTRRALLGAAAVAPALVPGVRPVQGSATGLAGYVEAYHAAVAALAEIDRQVAAAQETLARLDDLEHAPGGPWVRLYEAAEALECLPATTPEEAAEKLAVARLHLDYGWSDPGRHRFLEQAEEEAARFMPPPGGATSYER
jgi:hypothetical protein